MKIRRGFLSERNIGRLPFVGTELFRKSNRPEHGSVHSRMTDKMKLTDSLLRRFGFVEQAPYCALALDRAHDDFSLETVFALLASQRLGHHGELLTAFPVKRRIDNDDEFVSQRTSRY